MFDYHTHTCYSDDCSTPVEEMIQGAVKVGLKEMVITDHYDPEYPNRDLPFNIDFDAYHKALDRYCSKTYSGGLTLKKGLEIGIQSHALTQCNDAATSYPYDFIIGSFHCAEGIELFAGTFFDNRSLEKSYVAFYSYMYECLKTYENFDVLGHFNVIDRYGPGVPEDGVYWEEADAVIRLLAEKGKGLEVNTSSFRYGMEDRTLPPLNVLKRFREVGGEIVTAGSDAHRPQDVGYKLDWAQELLKSAGFTYVATFDQRKPNFHKL